MKPAISAITLVLFFVAACAHTNSSTVCSESRDLHCLTTPQCAMDPARGCQVCKCSPAIDPPAR